MELARLNPAYLAYELAMAALAVATIVLSLQPPSPRGELAIAIIWGAFVTDYGIRLALARGRLQFVRENWLDLVAIMPVGLFRAARLFRLVRLLRVLRGMAVLWRVSGTVRGILRTNQLGYVMLFTAAVIVAGGIIIYQVEPEIGTLADGLWWSVVTATTVGYGDISPKTTLGRVLAAVLMLAGIGTIGMITGSIATYFIGSKGSINAHIRHVQLQLDRWEDMAREERQQVVRILEALNADSTERKE